jgi:hypothetical protein
LFSACLAPALTDPVKWFAHAMICAMVCDGLSVVAAITMQELRRLLGLKMMSN